MIKENHEIKVPVGSVYLEGILSVPEKAKTIVIFSHGSGSSRFSPRNTFVSGVLNEREMATLLIDLLTPEEDSIYENRFDIDLLTVRLVAVTRFIHAQKEFSDFRIGYFGASTGAASAINAAGILGALISAIVSRGGRPDLANADFALIKAPTLLIVGGLDVTVREWNEAVYRDLKCVKNMVIVEGATHLFEEEGKLEEVSSLASSWFQRYLVRNSFEKAAHRHHDF